MPVRKRRFSTREADVRMRDALTMPAANASVSNPLPPFSFADQYCRTCYTDAESRLACGRAAVVRYGGLGWAVLG
jgi:hypothetical protein